MFKLNYITPFFEIMDVEAEIDMLQSSYNGTNFTESFLNDGEEDL